MFCCHIFVYHVHAWWRPKEGIRSPKTEITDDCEPSWELGTKPESSELAASALNCCYATSPAFRYSVYLKYETYWVRSNYYTHASLYPKVLAESEVEAERLWEGPHLWWPPLPHRPLWVAWTDQVPVHSDLGPLQSLPVPQPESNPCWSSFLSNPPLAQTQ